MAKARRLGILQTSLFALGALLLAGSKALAAPLSAAELFLDPAVVPQDDYARVYLPDLMSVHSYTWHGTTPIVAAHILPPLKAGEYGPAYVFGLADYLLTPTVDYTGDLDASAGTFTAAFDAAGVYEVQLLFAEGPAEIFTVFADAGLKEDGKKPDKTGPVKKIDPLPDADLFLVEKRDAILDNSAAIWEKGGRTVQRTTSVQDAIDKIKAMSEKLGRKIHVELDGHGYAGYISVGGGWQKGEGYYLDKSNVEKFQEAIDPYVSYITFQGCSTGADADGAAFLAALAKSIGSAGAWNQPVSVVDKSYFTIGINGKFVKDEVPPQVPEPATLVLLLGGVLLLAVARRDLATVIVNQQKRGVAAQ